MQVDKIEMGTVVDHIKAGKAGKVMKLLDIGEKYPHRVAIVLNVPSKRMGTKDILKIEGKMVSQEMANLIALVSPGATVNIVKGGEVEKKYEVVLPKEVKEYGKCPNPNCITGESGQRYFKIDRDGYRCHFCERLFQAEELV
ncbi:Aspartate carbamoyltransferase regulatory chain [Candidatus Bilamarchaeum dharawalense]|uniref:Aspartate carbamoyltransferase regulatory chain n=1 Tax=Candidatus Bilamarchaeum dharawalense TaxID=2885759 RepID=A0A5E4LLB8_9ARCH|nr:Aspartate carbamoyltransferase regulatory chain [Candidatus Bilamarchaeum dharawalense]